MPPKGQVHGHPDALATAAESCLRAAPDAALSPTPPSAPVWPWVLLALAAGVIAGATLIPNAEPIAQVVDAGGEE